MNARVDVDLLTGAADAVVELRQGVRWCSSSTIARCAARAASTASTCATVSAGCPSGIGTP